MRGAPPGALRSAAFAVALLAVVVAVAPPAARADLRVAAFAFAVAMLWLLRAAEARQWLPAAALALASVAGWDLHVALSGGSAGIDGAIGLAAIAAAGLCVPSQSPAMRFGITAGTAAPLAMLALFTTFGPLRSGSEPRLAAVVFAVTCAFAAALSGIEALHAGRARGQREAPLAARFAIAAVIAMGVLDVLGWLIGSRLVLQGGTSLVPTQFNTALSLFVLGIALASALRGRAKTVVVLVVLVVVHAGLSLLQEYGGLEIALDQLFWKHRVVAENVPPGRMAPNTAMSLLVGALGAYATLRSRRESGWWPVVWGCGLIVTAIVVLAAVGFGLQLVRLRAWGEHAPMALPTMFALAALAVALLALGLGHARARTMPATLVPAAFAIGAMVLSIYTWDVLATNQADARRTEAFAAAQSVSDGLRTFMRTRVASLGRFAERLAPLTSEALEPAFRDDAKRILRDFPGLFAIAWVDGDGIVRWIESPENLARFIDTPFAAEERRAAALARARDAGEIVITPPVTLRAGGDGFIVVVPALAGTTPRGYVTAIIRYEPLMDAMLATTALGYGIELRDGDHPFYVRDVPTGSRLEVSSSVELFSRQWIATVRPARAPSAAAERLPELVLFGGLLLGGLVAVSLRLALISRARATQAEAASAALRREAGERERTQRELEESRNELTAILESSPDGFVLFDREWRFLYINPQAAGIAHRPREELVGKVFWDEFPGADGDPTTEHLRTAMATRQPDSFESWFAPLQGWFGVVAFPHPAGLAVFVRDITAQRDVHERVRRSESSLARAQRIAGLGSWEVSLVPGGIESGELQWSQQTYRIFGLEPGMVTATMAIFHDRVHPEDLELVREAMAQAVAGRNPFSVDHRIVLPRGGIRHVHQEGDFLFDARGEPIRLVGTVQDITARKQAEEELRFALEGVEARNRELQDFAFVASHDLQEPLRKIQAFGERLSDRASLDAQGQDYLQRMRHAAARMQTLIDDLLAYSRVATRGQAFAAVDLEAVAREVLTDLESAIESAGAEVRIGRLPVVQADPTQMRQLLQNLLSNSLKFRAPGRTPMVSIDAERFDRPGPEASSRRERWCRIIVRDNGIGFESRYRERILQPFQRLHGRGDYEGTGIGLAIVRRIVERHGGTIAADGVAGEGATFEIELPLERLSARSDGRTTLATGDAGTE